MTPEKERFGSHRSFALGDIFDLPGGPDGEMDIEGLSIDQGYLWITGSHSLKRSDPEPGAEDLSGLETMEVDPNRGFLGRVPLIDRGDGVLQPVAEIATFDAEARRAACLKMRRDDGRTILRKQLAKDPLLAPFLDLPCKENGFDIEGLASLGDRVWLGLRGPVIGKHALLVEMLMKTTASGSLKPRRWDDGRRYRLLALPLDGLGVRDLLIVDDHLLVLAGATTDVEGPQTVYALPIPEPEGPAVIPTEQIQTVLDLPVRRGADHAEGLAVTSLRGRRQLIVAHDSPQQKRIDPENDRLTVDLFDLPSI